MHIFQASEQRHRWFWKLLKRVCKGSPSSCENIDDFWKTFSIEKSDYENGNQSEVGFLCNNIDELKCIYKISLYENSSILHEYQVTRAVQALSAVCPHFNRMYGVVKYKEDKRVYQMLLLEHIPHIDNFANFAPKMPVTIIVSILKQLMMAIRLARSRGISHNDLHTENVLIRRCSPQLILEYGLADGRKVRVPTYGYFASIIDFGFGFAPDDEHPLLCTYQFTHRGYICDRFDPFVDYIHLFCALAHDIRKIKEWKTRRLCIYLRSWFKDISSIDLSNGWSKFPIQSGTESFEKEIKKHAIIARVELTKDGSWVQSLQRLIQHPLSEPTTPPAHYGFIDELFGEWIKFEERIKNIDTLNYIFRILVEAAAAVRDEYFQNTETSKPVALFRDSFLASYGEVVAFHCPTVCYERILCALFLAASFLENFLACHMEKVARFKRIQSLKFSFNETNCDDTLWDGLCAIFPDTSSVRDSGSEKIFKISF